ncbi:MAG: GGDEF domain-containing protein [Deltaproteobacteria bacterium]|nr:GGDEF domain-containing protein [Deltaproteobacteria bacterium]
MKNPVWKKLSAPGRKSDLLLAVVLILIFISFVFSDRSSTETVKHIMTAFGFILMYLRYLKPADYSVDLLSDALKEHGEEIPCRNDPMGLADSVKDKIEQLSAEVALLKQERQQMKDQRLIELAKMHQDLLTHHRCTKKMLGSFRMEEVFDALQKGIREGLGFQGATLGVVDRDGYLAFHEEFDIATGPSVVKVPVWSEESLLAGAVWSGNSILSGSLADNPHCREDGIVVGEGAFFILPVSRKTGARCSEVKNCGNVDCTAYLSRSGRCWVEHSADCVSNASIPVPERRKACALCEMFSQTAVLAVRTREESRKVSRETVVPIVTLANEASMALEVVELHENMRKMSITDGLTGLYNHREFYQQLRRELERARRYRHSVSLLIIDVDDFKRFNDSFGHLAGDLALRKISDLLRNCARATDIVARYGGEEFAVILPESTSAGALMLAERIKTEVARHDFLPQVPGEVHLTVSIGIYTAEEGAATEDQLVRYADEAAYSAKSAGKNRVVVKAHV